MSEQNSNINANQATVGLNTDSTANQLSPGSLTYALNAGIENFDGNIVTYQNETSNIKCITFPEGYTVIGTKNLIEINKIIFFLTDGKGNSQIGYAIEGSCQYIVAIDDTVQGSDKLNFNLNYPILKVVSKTTNCSTQIYWTDGLNPRRYLDLEFILCPSCSAANNTFPWKSIPNPVNAFQPIEQIGQLDSNKLLVQPNFSIPEIVPTEVTVGGILPMGTYQFAIQYCDSLGEGYTSFYSITNPLGIFEQKIGETLNLPTSQAIALAISNLDISGLYDYFNIAVVKTINNITTVDLVGTFPILNTSYSYTYTGVETTNIKLTITDILEQSPYYEVAQDVFSVDNVLGWDNLIEAEDVNYQQIWSKVNLLWETHKIPYTRFQGYSNGLNTEAYKGYMRDEVYSFEGRFILKNGQKTNSFHIPGRIKNTSDDIPLVDINNQDLDAIVTDVCEAPTPKERWKVYNTATRIDYTDEYKANGINNICYEGSYEYGTMAYWESTDKYPSNEAIWGDLSGQPIRHHKFPDSLVTHIYSSDTKNDLFIYPIGVRIDVTSFYDAIKNSSLTEAQKNQIAGFEIARGNRTANKSVIAKGLFNNVGKYSFTPPEGGSSQTYYYANYPYNDLRPDPYFVTQHMSNHIGYRPDLSLDGFTKADVNSDARSRFSFHSPDTHFYQPSISSGLQLKLETIEYGQSKGHFVAVKKNAEYKFLSSETVYAAAGIAVSGSMGYGEGTFGWPVLHLSNAVPGFTETLDLFRKLIPYTNFGYTYNSYGSYNKSYQIPNDQGEKIRLINFAKYLTDGVQGIEDGNLINNYRRESSVYLNTTYKLLFPDEYSLAIPQDESRYNLASYTTNTYTIAEFLYNFIATNSDIVTDNTITTAINRFYNAASIPDTITVTFNIPSVITTDVPSVGDIYRLGSVNYVVQIVNSVPIGATTSQVTLITTVQVISLYTPPPTFGTLALVSLDDPSETSATTLGYISYIAVNSSASSSLSDIRTKLQSVAFAGATLADIEALNNGCSDCSTGCDCFAQIAYNAFYAQFYSEIQTNNTPQAPGDIRSTNIASYYGSIKQIIDNQWGQIYSYETIYTGFYNDLFQKDGTNFPSFPTVFGGDIYINRFALKTKTSIFVDNTVNNPDDTDIQYDYLANYGYPMFWLSTKPQDVVVDIKSDIDAIYKIIQSSPGVGGSGSTLSKIWTVIKGIFSGGMFAIPTVIKLLIDIFNQLKKNILVPNTNFDNFQLEGIMEQGLMYLFNYGIPYFFVESEVNVDYRQATNDLEGNFYPNVGDGIPDDWLQEVNVPIINDNNYTYNQTYSKQNKEEYFSHLRENYDPNNKCFTNFPNRAIWSDKSNLEETKNNWLVYRPSAFYDFPKAYGKLTSLDNLENIQVLARFENKSQIYNALTTVQVSQGPAAYLGNSALFSATPPIDLAESDLGYAGSQHKLLLKTEFGHVFVDASRGQVILLQGSKVNDIASKGMNKWFAENLPFNITNSFLDIDIDNCYNGLGLTGSYDPFYQRFFITKLDYQPLIQGITYDGTNFKFADSIINLSDSKYFCNKSWTISYNFKTQTWISFHSFIPNYYIGNNLYFQTGIKSNNTLWNHNQTFFSFQEYYGTQYPYVLEYPFVYKYQDEILKNVKEYCSAIKYTDFNVYYEPKELIYFNKAIIYNRQQCSGLLNLIPKSNSNMAQQFMYPKYNSTSKDILVSKADNFYNYNTFWDIIKDPNKPCFTSSCDLSLENISLDNTNLDYSNKIIRNQFRAKDLRIREILDNRNDIKLLSRFITSPTTTSYL